MYTSERSMFYMFYLSDKLTWFKDLSGHFVVGVVGVGVEKMSSFHGSFLFPFVSLSPSGGEGGNCSPYELRND